MIDRQYLTVEQAADELQLHPETIRRMLREGRLAGHRFGGRKAGWRIPRRAVEGLLSGTASAARPSSAGGLVMALGQAEQARARGDAAEERRWSEIAAGIERSTLD